MRKIIQDAKYEFKSDLSNKKIPMEDVGSYLVLDVFVKAENGEIESQLFELDISMDEATELLAYLRKKYPKSENLFGHYIYLRKTKG